MIFLLFFEHLLIIFRSSILGFAYVNLQNWKMMTKVHSSPEMC